VETARRLVHVSYGSVLSFDCRKKIWTELSLRLFRWAV
jgi:hypothetical protein